MKKIEIKNLLTIKSIRYGHANNSSSSHSLVFLRDNKVEDDWDEDGFGWELFTLSSKKLKSFYFLESLYNSLETDFYHSPRMILIEKKVNKSILKEVEINKEIEVDEFSQLVQATQRFNYAKKIIKEEFSDVFNKKAIEKFIKEKQKNINNYFSKYYIDHQSSICLPVDKYGFTAINFLKQFFKILIDNNFVILGGNDNGGDNHPHKNKHIKNPFSKKIMQVMNALQWGYNGILVIYDEKNNDWILQNKKTGNKIRISLDKFSKDTSKSGFPELIDLKITNKCENKCKFCYQSSKPDGKHAKFEDIKKIIDMLAESNVMEIAIGGGEPTLHPNFKEIINYIQKKNMLVAFSTKNYNILTKDFFKNTINNIDSFAISCQTKEDIQKLREKDDEIPALYNLNTKIYIQTILELLNEEELEEIIKFCEYFDIDLTLLGYKEFGFGKSKKLSKLKPIWNWIDKIKDLYINVGVDSSVVKRYKKELLENDCDELMLIGEEGKFSCYIDAVEKIIAPSSFTKENITKLNLSKNNILEEFSKF